MEIWKSILETEDFFFWSGLQAALKGTQNHWWFYLAKGACDSLLGLKDEGLFSLSCARDFQGSTQRGQQWNSSGSEVLSEVR